MQRSSDFDAERDDLRLRLVDQRCQHAYGVSFNSTLERQRRRLLERLDELRPAIGVAAVVEGVDAEVAGSGVSRLAHSHRHGQEDEVAGGYVGGRDLTAGDRLRYGDGLIR